MENKSLPLLVKLTRQNGANLTDRPVIILFLFPLNYVLTIWMHGSRCRVRLVGKFVVRIVFWELCCGRTATSN